MSGGTGGETSYSSEESPRVHGPFRGSGRVSGADNVLFANKAWKAGIMNCKVIKEIESYL